MKNTKFYKHLFIVILSLLVVLSFFNLIKLFISSEGVLISSLELKKINQSINSYANDTNTYKLLSLEGNKKYISITYASADYNLGYKRLTILYDAKRNKIIDSLEVEGNTVSLLDCSFVKYAGDNLFLILDSFGNFYRLDTESKDLTPKLLMETGIKKENLFKHYFKDKSIYIISRDNLSKYNEKTLSNNKMLEIRFKNQKFKKADTITYNFNESDFVYSFVLDSNGNIGVVGSSSTNVLGEITNNLLLPTDKDYLNTVPSFDKNYKFIDTSSIWVRFLNDDSLFSVKEDNLNLEYRSIHSLVNKKLNINVSSPYNVPIFMNEDFTLFSGFKYEDLLNNASFFPVSDVIKTYTESGKEKEISSSIRNHTFWFNYKTNKYISFFQTKDGIAGINKKGEINNLFSFTTGFVYKNLSIYLEENTIKFKKI